VRAVLLKLALVKSSHEIHREVGDRCALFVKRGHTNTLWVRSWFLSVSSRIGTFCGLYKSSNGSNM
jgi:hypothetical protein